MTRWIVLAVALVVGLFLLSYDQRTDDTGVEASLLVATSLALTLAAPRVAIAIALAIGLPIAAWSVWHGNGAAGRPLHHARRPCGEPARNGLLGADDRDERGRSELPEPCCRFRERLRVGEWTPVGVGRRELDHEAVVCDLAHLHVANGIHPPRLRVSSPAGCVGGSTSVPASALSASIAC